MPIFPPQKSLLLFRECEMASVMLFLSRYLIDENKNQPSLFSSISFFPRLKILIFFHSFFFFSSLVESCPVSKGLIQSLLSFLVFISPHHFALTREKRKRKSFRETSSRVVAFISLPQYLKASIDIQKQNLTTLEIVRNVKHNSKFFASK